MPNKKTSSEKQLSQAVDKLSNKISTLNVSKPSKSARKRANRRLKRQANNGGMTINRPYTTNSIISQSTDTGLRRLKTIARPNGLTDQGVSFLKCAFAPPDFQQNAIAGVPDEYRGPSLVRKHRYVAPFTFVAGNDYYFILAPTPGVAYWSTSTITPAAVVAATVFNAVNYTDAATMFGTPGNTANNVTKFRFVSNHFELIPTINQMVWSGNVQAFKIPLAVILREGGASVNDLWSVTGINGVNSNLASQFSGPFIQGVYTACYNSNGTFPFDKVPENIGAVPAALTPGVDFGVLNPSGGLGFTGLDSQFECMVIKVTGITANETALIKTWACVEYLVTPDSTLSEFQSLSPYDPVALDLYREVILNLPIGVPFEDNENFWNRVLSIIRDISGFASVLPGPYGMLARGTNLLSNGALSLMR